MKSWASQKHDEQFFANKNEVRILAEATSYKVKIPPMTCRVFPAIAICLMLLLAGRQHLTAQHTCLTAVEIAYDSLHTFTMLPEVERLWVTLSADSTSSFLLIKPGLYNTGFDTIIIHTGTCNQLSHYLSAGATDSAVGIKFNDTVQQFLIEIVRSDAADTGQILVALSQIFLPATSPPGICNLLSNSDFETLNPAAQSYGGSTGSHSIQRNFLTDWEYGWGTPNIVPQQTWDPNVNHAIFIWSYLNNDGEAIFQDFSGLIANNRYKLMIDVKHGQLNAHPVLRAAFTNLYTPSPQSLQIGGAGPKPTSYSANIYVAHSNLPGLSSNQFTTYSFPFTFQNTWFADPQSGISRLTIYNTSSPVNNTAAMIIDNVLIVPDEEVSLNVTCDEVFATLSGSYTNVQYDWYDDPSMTTPILTNSATLPLSGLSLPGTFWVKATCQRLSHFKNCCT